MRWAIRKPDGSRLSDGEWNGIRAATNLVKMDLFSNLGFDPSVPKKKTYLQSEHPKEWNMAIKELEKQQSVLALCASHWKAEYMLGSVLNHSAQKGESKDRDGSKDKELDGNSNEGDGVEEHALSSGFKRPHRPSESQKAKRKKKTNENKPLQQSKCIISIHYTYQTDVWCTI